MHGRGRDTQNARDFPQTPPRLFFFVEGSGFGGRLSPRVRGGSSRGKKGSRVRTADSRVLLTVGTHDMTSISSTRFASSDSFGETPNAQSGVYPNPWKPVFRGGCAHLCAKKRKGKADSRLIGQAYGAYSPEMASPALSFCLSSTG